MEINIPKRFVFILIVVILLVAAGAIALPTTGRSVAQVIGYDSGLEAAIAGTETFYSVNYQEGPDLWAVRLCSISTTQACGYHNTVGAYLWPEFEAAETHVVAEATGGEKLADEVAGTREDALMQVWTVTVTLSKPWPQGDGATSFPATILVVQEDGWKFERFLLEDELARYTGGES